MRARRVGRRRVGSDADRWRGDLRALCYVVVVVCSRGRSTVRGRGDPGGMRDARVLDLVLVPYTSL